MEARTPQATPQVDITELKSGIKVAFTATPGVGYVEDLRSFYIKPNQDGLLYPAVDGAELGISYYGNTVEPYSSFQQYSVADIPLLVSAIESYYSDIENGTMPKFLGDGDFDPPGYKLFSTGEDFVFPAGCPILIKDNTFVLAWDEISGSWESLDTGIVTTPLTIASYSNTTSPNPGTPLQSVSSSTSFTLSNTFPQSITINIAGQR